MEKIRNYAWWAWPVLMVLLFHNLSISATDISNFNPVTILPDRIHTGHEPSMEKLVLPAMNTNQSMTGEQAAWVGMDNNVLSDDQYITVNLASEQESASLYFDNFDFSLPKGATIQAFKILIEGYSIGEEKPYEILVALVDDNDELISINYAQKVSKGKSWPSPDKEKLWKYGIINEDWLSNLDAGFMNEGNWKIKLQLVNDSDEPMDLAIDQLSVEIFYTPLYTLCKEDCGIAFVEEEGAGYDYNWILPEGMEITSELENHHIINFMMTDRNYGVKEICVEITAPGGEQETLCRDILFMNCSPSIIGDYAWLDLNGNGLQDNSEVGLNGVPLVLAESNGNRIDTLWTDSVGYYAFLDIAPGNYYIEALYDGELIPSFYNMGGDSIPDNSFTNIDGKLRTPVFYIDFDQDYMEADLGLMPGASIGDFVWLDENGDGLQQSVETGIEDISVRLYKDNILVDTLLTDVEGSYVFDKLLPGEYQLCFDFPDVAIVTNQLAGSNDLNSDIEADGCTGNIALVLGEVRTDVDAGVFYYGAIGDFVWEDLNEDGIQNDGDSSGIEGMTIQLFDAGTDQLLQITYSDENGEYGYENLLPGNYYLSFETTIPFQPTSQFVGQDVDLDSDVLLMDGKYKTAELNITSGDIRKDIDAGFVLLKSGIGDYVWLDWNEDGIQDIDEPGINGIEIQLYDGSGNYLTNTNSVTGLDGQEGFFAFKNLVPGDYYLKANIPDLYLFTNAAGGSPEVDSDIDGTNGNGTSRTITLLPDEYNEDLDIGLLYNYGNIGDYVWLDLNEDGIQDDLEYGLNNFKLYLLDENEQTVDSTITGLDPVTGDYGYYHFDKVIPANYYVALAPLEDGYEPTVTDAGPEDIDSDISWSGNQIMTELFTLLPGQDTFDIDAGLLLKNASISGYTWFDENENGTRETDEPLLAGIEVKLFNESGIELDNDFTEADGNYGFKWMSLGDYYLVFESRDEWLFTVPDIGIDLEDSDVTSANGNGSTDIINLDLSEQKIHVDAAYVHNYGSIGDLVWLDQNENGLFDTNEPGVENIELLLFNPAGNQSGSTQTDASGNYTFEKVIPGDYYIQINVPEKYNLTQADAGDESLDSDITGTNGIFSSDVFTVAGGQERTDKDAGLIGKPILIGDFVWLDLNRNAMQDIDEPGLNGLAIELYDQNSVLIESTITGTHPDSGGDGYYLFNPVTPGDYYLVLDIPRDYIATEPGVGSEDLDSDISTAFGPGSTDLVNLDFGDESLDIDLGLVFKTASVGDYIWKDLNENGIQDDDNSGIDEVELELYNEAGDLIRTITSYSENGNSGYYLFASLDPGIYYIEVLLNEELQATVLNTGSEVEDSDLTVFGQSYRSELFQLIPDEHRIDIDFGVIDKRGLINGLVWYDIDQDGQFLDPEAGINSVEVLLYEENGTYINNTFTDVDGQYQFSYIKPGAYYLQYIIDDAYEPTIFQAGLDPSIDSDINSLIAYGSTPIFTINPGDVIEDIYGGFIDKPLVIGDRVWIDEDQDGEQDPGENGLNGVEIRLYDSDGQYLSVTQSGFNPKDGSAGYYAFKNIAEGVYYLRFIVPTSYISTIGDAIADDELDSDVLELFGAGTTDTFYYSGNEDILNIDAGFYSDTYSTIGDFVWLDENGNGIQDIGEPGMNDITIELYKNNGDFVKSTQSTIDPDSGMDGYYLFDNISSGKYYIKVILPDTLYVTLSGQGSDDELDNDINHGNGAATSPTIDLSIQEKDTSIDVGLFELAHVGDFVWDDSNSNGIQDVGETGVNDVLVELFDLNENPISSTFTGNLGETGATGYYLFSNIDPGQYYIKFHIDENVEFSLFNATSDDLDSDVTGAYGVGTTSLFQLNSNQIRLDVDAGISLEGGDINGHAWLDVNADGIYNAGEEGLNAILVKLMREDGTQASQVYSYNDLQSGIAGYYEFRNVPEGNYYLEIVKPDDYLFTITNAGTDDDLDSEVDESFGPGTTGLFTIVNEQLVELFNAGMYIPASIGDYVWYDSNQDGLQDNDENGAADITVILLKNGNIPADTTYTDENGKYAFTSLQQGVYAVLFKAPQEYAFTARNVGSDDSIDSDAAGNGKSSLISLAHGAKFKDLDAGLVPLFNLVGNHIWLDSNANGTYEEGETSLEGAEISLYTEHDVFIERTFSDEFGEYHFYNLKPGEYYVKAVRNDLNAEQDDRNDENDNYPMEEQTGVFFIDYDSYLDDKDIPFMPLDEQIVSTKDIPELLIYPNPFQSNIRIDLSRLDVRPNKVIITDMAGNVVLQQRIGIFVRDVYLNLSHLPTNNFMVRLLDGKNILGQKIIYKAEE